MVKGKQVFEFSLTIVKLIPMIIGAVHAVEKIGSMSKGKEKQDAAVEAIVAMIAASEIAIDSELINEESFRDLIRVAIDNYVAIQNYIAERKKT